MNKIKRILALMMTMLLLFVSFSSSTVSYAAAKKISSIKLSKTSVTFYVGDTYKLKTEIKPESATNKKLSWTTSNKNIVTVSSGKLTAKKAGTATVTAKSTDGSGKKVSCKVTVKNRKVTSVDLNKAKATVYLGETLKLKAEISPANATNKKLSWKSSNSKVAAVNSEGKVTAKSSGTATITVTTKDGNKKASCKITVKKMYTVPGTDLSVSVETPIWVPTKGGAKFHVKPNCSNMKEPEEITVRTAVKRGFDPCKKCFKYQQTAA